MLIASLAGAGHTGSTARIFEEGHADAPLAGGHRSGKSLARLMPVLEGRLQVIALWPAPVFREPVHRLLEHEQAPENEASSHHPAESPLPPVDVELRHTGGQGARNRTEEK